MWDSAMAENGILKCGRLTDFQTHQIEHQLGAYTDCNHGQGLAVIHPVYYRHIVKDAPEKFARLAKDVFGQDTAEAGVAALESVPFPVSWTVKMKKKQKETQDILSYHTQAAGCSDKARAKASGGRQPIEECGRTGL